MSTALHRSRRIPKYRCNITTGRAVVTIAGHDHWLGKYGTPESRQAYDRLIAEWLASGRQAIIADNPDDELTIVQLIDRFWTHAQTYYVNADGTTSQEAENYKLALRPLKDLYGSTKAVDFSPKRLAAVRQKMIQDGWCRNVINRQVGRIKYVFAWAVGQDLIPAVIQDGKNIKSICESLSKLPGLRKGKSEARETAKVKPVPQAAVDAVRPFLSPQIEAMMDLQLLTGMRSTEVCIMRGIDIDRSGEVWVYRPAFHKTEHHGIAREIYMGPRARAIVEKHLKLNTTAYLFSPADAEAWRYSQCKIHRRPRQKANERKSDRELRERYDKNTYGRAIAYACVKAFPPPGDLARREDESGKAWMKRLMPEQKKAVKVWQREHQWHPHQLRHSAGTRLRKEFGLEHARVILGHSSMDMTETYAEQDREKAREIMAQVG